MQVELVGWIKHRDMGSSPLTCSHSLNVPCKLWSLQTISFQYSGIWSQSQLATLTPKQCFYISRYKFHLARNIEGIVDFWPESNDAIKNASVTLSLEKWAESQRTVCHCTEQPVSPHFRLDWGENGEWIHLTHAPVNLRNHNAMKVDHSSTRMLTMQPP